MQMATPCSSWITHEVSLVRSIALPRLALIRDRSYSKNIERGEQGTHSHLTPMKLANCQLTFARSVSQSVIISLLRWFLQSFYGSAMTWSSTTVRYEAAHSRLAKAVFNRRAQLVIDHYIYICVRKRNESRDRKRVMPCAMPIPPELWFCRPFS